VTDLNLIPSRVPAGREKALREAEALLDRIDPKKNDRGYDRNTAALTERIEAILRVADWLLGDGKAPVPFDTEDDL